MIDRAKFFEFAKRAPLGSKLTQQQVDGLEAIIAYWEEHTPAGLDDRALAYVLATAQHETGARFEPVRETNAKTDAQARKSAYILSKEYGKPDPETGFVYYGRGLVQLTWKENYAKAGKLVGEDLVGDPDLALDDAIAVKVLVEGMVKGLFTGRKLAQYFAKGARGNTDDPEGARAIINGTDKKALIAGYQNSFLVALNAARVEAKVVAKQIADPSIPNPEPKPVPVDKPNLVKDKITVGGAITAAGGVAGLGSLGKGLLENLNNPWAFAAFGLVFVTLVVGSVLVWSGRLSIARKGGV